MLGPLASMATLPSASTAPHAPSLPLLGSGVQLLRDPYRWWARQYQALGPVFRLEIPTDRFKWIAIAGREANELVARDGHRLFDQSLTYPRAKVGLKTPTHPSITEGKLQRHLRRQVSPGFSRQAVSPHLPAMTAWVRRYVDRWRSGQRFNVTEELARLGLNCISIFATGRDIGEATEDYRRYAIVFTGVLAMNWPMATLRWPWVKRAREGLDQMIVERFAEHERVPPGEQRQPDYFDFISRGTLPDGSPLPERVKIVFGQIPFKNMGVYAGRVMNHVLVQLVQRPEVLARVQPEIDQTLADDEVTLEEIAGMNMFRAAIKETLRILPTAVALQRTVCEPFEFAGYRFSVGDRLFLPLSATHFLPEFFPHPDRFDIDRYDLKRAEDRQRFVYNPFGLGNHACVAQGVFESIMIVVVGTILHRWRLDARYSLRTVVDALPGPWPFHKMRIVARRDAAPAPGKRRRSPTQRDALSAALRDRIEGAPELHLEDGQQLFAQGDEPDKLYFILSGQLRIVRERDNGEDLHLATLGGGEVVGEIGVLHGLPRSASVAAEGQTTLLVVDSNTFWDAVVQNDITAVELGDLAMRRHASTVIAAVLDSGRTPRLSEDGEVEEIELGPYMDIYRRGQPAEYFYVLIQGNAEELADGGEGEPRVLHEFAAPDCFGEIGLLRGRPRASTVRSGSEGARILRLDRVVFGQLTDQSEARTGLMMLARAREAARDSS